MLFFLFSLVKSEEDLQTESIVDSGYHKVTIMKDGKEMTIISNQNLSNCYDPSKKPGPNGTCICQDGYFHDEPMTDRGCWICLPSCGLGMSCEYPGVCKCLPGYYVHDFRRCKRAIPFVTSYFPTSGKSLTVVSLSLKSLANFTAQKVYCKFNTTVTNGTLVDPNLAQCTIPYIRSSKKNENLKLYLSYDGGNWSTQDIQFKVYDVRMELNNTSFYIAGVVIVAIIIVSIRRYLFFMKKGQGQDSGDGQPLLHSNEKY